MLNRKEVVASPGGGLHNVLSSGTVLTGNLVTDDDIRIDGVIEGNIVSQGKIIIGGNGTVSGDIECNNLDVLGKIIGNVQCSEIVVLRISANVTGDIRTQTIEIEPGAKFSGLCRMNQE
jgi:cytoskeletal protein CcmA (bactofilin family)